MKKLFASLLFIVAACGVQAADRVTASVTINSAAANDNTFIVNGVTRTWKTSVTVPATQILVGATANEANTNLVNHLLSTPFSRVVVYQTGAATLRLDADTGVALVLGGVGGYYTVTYSTQTVATAYDVIVPYTSFPSVRRQTITEGLVDWLNLASGKAIFENSASISNLLGRTNFQAVPGIKQFTNIAGLWQGVVSNSPAIGGIVSYLTNGLWTNGVLTGPTLTNATFYGTANRFIGDIDFSGNLTLDGFASIIDATGDYFSFTPETGLPVYLGLYATVEGVTADNGRFTNNVYAGHLWSSNHNSEGWSQFRNTNTFLANSDIAFTRLAVTTLANGNNAAVPVGTNVYVEVSGPSSSFTINGINGSPNRDGKYLIIDNQTGFDMTIANQSGTDPTAGNRIITNTGADRSTTGNGTAILIYSGAASRWRLISLDP